MTDSYSPVVRIPKQQAMHTDHNNKTTLWNDFDDFLVSKILYIGDLPNSIRETDIKTLLQHCMPVEMYIRREDDQDEEAGYLRFTNFRYADRAYTLYHGFKFTNGATLQLRMYSNPSLEPEALGDILEISNLAPETDDVHRIYDIFRPFGPLQLCISNGEGTAMIQYFSKESSDKAIYQMDGIVLDGNKITITSEPIEHDQDRTLTPVLLSPTPSVTSPEQQEHEQNQHDHQQAEKHSLQNNDLQENQQNQQHQRQEEQHSLQSNDLQESQQNHQQQEKHSHPQDNDQQQNQQRTPNLAAISYVDHMNLYIKNMDHQITNNHLQTLFGKFGRIVSARVISNPVTKQSKGYGFVSFSKEDEAAQALKEMNGQVVFSKPLYISYHVPKKGRSEQTNTSKSSNTTSKLNGNGADHHHLASNLQQPSPDARLDYQQPIVHNIGSTTSFQQQSYNSSPVINLPRRQELSFQQYQPSAIMTVESNPCKSNATIKLPRRKSNVAQSAAVKQSTILPVISPTSNTTQHTPNVMKYQQEIYQPNLPTGWTHLISTASSTPEMRRISIESMPSVMTDTSTSIQRQKLTEAVLRYGCCSKERSTDIVDLLMTLSRKERSLCLFNADFLKEKVDLALESLDICDDDYDNDDDDDDDFNGAKVDGNDIAAISRMASRVVGGKHQEYEIRSPLPRTSKTTPKLINNTNVHLPITPPSSSLSITDFNGGRVSTTDIDDFLDSIASLSIRTQKQKLGDIMWSYVKPLAKPLAKHHRVPGFSSKILVDLLDNIPLRDLAHGINDSKWLKTKVEEAANTIHRS